MSSNNLMDLIKLAIGDRSFTSFAKECGVSAGSLSRMLRKDRPQQPTPGTLRKISEYSQNGVTYDDLMTAAGYIFGNPAKVDSPGNEFDLDSFMDTFQTDTSDSIPKEILLDDKIDSLKKELLANYKIVKFKDGTSIDKNILEGFLENIEVAFEYAKKKSKQ